MRVLSRSSAAVACTKATLVDAQAMIDRQPDIQQRMQELMMPRIMSAQPKIMQLNKAFMQEQKAKAEAAKAAAEPQAPKEVTAP
jgi:hypothetical protein